MERSGAERSRLEWNEVERSGVEKGRDHQPLGERCLYFAKGRQVRSKNSYGAYLTIFKRVMLRAICSVPVYSVTVLPLPVYQSTITIIITVTVIIDSYYYYNYCYYHYYYAYYYYY